MRGAERVCEASRAGESEERHHVGVSLAGTAAPACWIPPPAPGRNSLPGSEGCAGSSRLEDRDRARYGHVCVIHKSMDIHVLFLICFIRYRVIMIGIIIKCTKCWKNRNTFTYTYCCI